MKLKTHQRQSAVAGLVGLRGPDHAALLIQPTASGKTVTMATIIKAELLRYRPRVLVLQHTTPLFGQNLDELQKICAGARFASIGAGRTSRGLATADVTVATVQAARGETMGYLAPFDLAVIDEAHHAAAPIYREVIAVLRERNPDLAVLGLTATPTRSDGQGIDFLFPRISHQVTFEDVLRSGLVVPPRVKAADLGAVSVALGAHAWTDGDAAEASKALRVEVTMDEVVRQHMAHAAGLRAVYFCCDTAHAEAMAAAFASAGLRAASVSYRTPKGELKAMLADYKDGAYDVLTNPLMLTEGFNDPGIGCVGLLRGFGTKELMVQAVGRGLRAHPGKREGLVLDFVHAAERHGDLFPRMDISSRVKRGGAATARTNGEPAEIINADHVLMAEIDMLGGLLDKVEIGGADLGSKPATQDGDAPVVMSRAEALALGLTTYFTGKTCKHGHVAERNMSGKCKICWAAKQKTPEYKEKKKVRDAQRHARSKLEIRIKQAARRATPEYRAKQVARRATPEYIAKQKKYLETYRGKQKYKENRAALMATSEYKAKQKVRDAKRHAKSPKSQALRATPEYRAKQKKYQAIYRSKQKYKEKLAEVRATPEYKAKQKAASAASYARKKQRQQNDNTLGGVHEKTQDRRADDHGFLAPNASNST